MAAVPTRWHALHEATRADVPRVPFFVAGRRAGSVAATHLGALRRFDGVDASPDAVSVDGRDLDARFARLHRALRDEALIVAWRDEAFPLYDPATLAPLATIERAACRFWGTLTLGAHCTGYVAGDDGRPQALWIAQRAFTKATDPGLYDNLVGGGVPAGQTPHEALLRESFEEAGLPEAVAAGARYAGALRLARDIREGFQHEWLHAWDLALPPGLQPANQDGEVAGFRLLAPADAAALAAGDGMTVDAALVTIDFLLRHRLVDDAQAAARLAALRVDEAVVRPG